MAALETDSHPFPEGSCPLVQIYNDGTGLVIEYPWFTRDDVEEEAGFIGKTLAKVTTAMTHMSAHAKLAIDLAVVGGVACGSLMGLLTAGPMTLGGFMGTAVQHGFASGLFF